MNTQATLVFTDSRVESVFPNRTYIYLLQQINTIGDDVIDGKTISIIETASWRALDKAVREIGHCRIVCSKLAD